jgi:hypothetical protein
MSYRRVLKTSLVTALKRTFDGNYPEQSLREMNVSIEYPIKSQDFPSVWVNFEEGMLQTAGIDHAEVDDDGNRVLRWRFDGHASYTVAAFSSLERDRIYDELVKIMAFSRSSDHLSAFRQYVEGNDLIAMNFDFDQIEVSGDAASPGTPWETDEMMYECTLVMQVLGEFTTSVDTGSLVPLSKIIVDGREWPSTELSPQNPGHIEITENNPPSPYAPDTPVQPFDFSSWH